jgi:hypothetical protein
MVKYRYEYYRNKQLFGHCQAAGQPDAPGGRGHFAACKRLKLAILTPPPPQHISIVILQYLV